MEVNSEHPIPYLALLGFSSPAIMSRISFFVMRLPSRSTAHLEQRQQMPIVGGCDARGHARKTVVSAGQKWVRTLSCTIPQNKTSRNQINDHDGTTIQNKTKLNTNLPQQKRQKNRGSLVFAWARGVDQCQDVSVRWEGSSYRSLDSNRRLE